MQDYINNTQHYSNQYFKFSQKGRAFLTNVNSLVFQTYINHISSLAYYMYVDVFKMPYLCSRSFTKKCFIPF